MIAALALGALLSERATLNLYRGAEVATPRYWDVTDTYLDAGNPETVYGGSYTLQGGKGLTILIKFGDLNRVVGPHKRIADATLYLTPSGGDVPVLKSADRVLVDWGEGPRTEITNLFKAPKEGAPEIPKWAANYRQRHAGFDSWEIPGANGPLDVTPIPGVHLQAEGAEFAVEGLQAPIQAMLDNPAENHGFALRFDSPSEFFSSKSPNGKPRLELQLEDVAPTTGPDLSVVRIDRSGDAYTGHIKNVGNASAKPFSVQWIVSGRGEKPTDVSNALGPGEETTVIFSDPEKPSPTDHRVHPLSLKVIPNGPDACPANNELTIEEDAIPIDVVVSPTVAQKLEQTNYLGSRCVEDWVQAQVELWNNTLAAQSRFSFALDGSLERLRLNSIRINSPGTGPSAVVDDSVDPFMASLPFLKSLGLAAGLLDGTVMQIGVGKVQVPGSTSRESHDLYPGIMGYGDTRFEGRVPGLFPMSYDPVFDPLLQQAVLQPTDLLSGNDVAALNRHLDARPDKPSDDLLPIKKAVIVRVLDLIGQPVPNTDLLFYQSSGGVIPAKGPAFAVRTNESGIAVLNARGVAGPFGDLSPNADNGVLMVQAKSNRVTETGWIKAWELNEESARGASTFTLHLNLPESQIDIEDLAADRLISDSAQDLPTKLAPLLVDANPTPVQLPSAKDSWLEIDLGRDRTIAEIDLVTNGDPFWNQFDVMVYGTGQHPEDSYPWARELDWIWTLQNRSDPGKSGNKIVAYRGSNQRVRYLRFVNRSGGAGSLSQIRVFGARLSP